MVIVSDDQRAFVFFLYDNIEWTAGEASNGVAAQVCAQELQYLYCMCTVHRSEAEHNDN